jgi:hypothetical protein
MDVNCNPISTWYQRLVLDPAFAAEFILVEPTAAARNI